MEEVLLLQQQPIIPSSVLPGDAFYEAKDSR